MGSIEAVRQFINMTVKELVKAPDEVRIETVGSQCDTHCLVIHCNPEDVSFVIGRFGKNIKALEALTKSVAAKNGVFVTLIVNK